ncbi:MAG: hypothetical protein ACREIC_32910 [Limisphaerales bacterium]
MNVPGLPVARELFAQWQRARGSRIELSARPFSRDWEELLEAAGLVSATDRNEAERDARALAVDGWLELKPVQYKPHLIARIQIPLVAEERWRTAFGFVPPSDEEARRIREFAWCPKLAFLRDTRINIPLADLQRLDAFLKQNATARDRVPIKERSLEIFLDEKRLDMLLNSALFRPDRLNLQRDLFCEIVGEPLHWKRGPLEAAQQPLIVLENAATWHSYCRWNAERKLFSAVIYGCGNRFVDGVRYIEDIFAELGGARPVFYFGDLDPQGLLIPQEASNRLQPLGLPAIEPHLWSYRKLLSLGAGREQPWDTEIVTPTLCDWLVDCAEPARRLFASGKRIAQECVGWEFLRGETP